MSYALLALLLAAADPEPAFPATLAKTRAGLSVVAIETPGASVATVQLHARTASGDRTPEIARATLAFVEALAEGRTGAPRELSVREEISAQGGETRIALDVDGFVVSDVVPAAALDVALRALDLRLQRRRRLAPSPRRALVVASAPAEIPLLARQLFAPGHGYAFALDGTAAPEPALLGAVADQALRRGDVVVVVTGPEPAAKLLARADRALRTPLPPGQGVTPPLPPLVGARAVDGVDVVLDEAVDGAPLSLVCVPLPPRPAPGTVDDAALALAQKARAAELILAEVSGLTLDERAATAVLVARVRTSAATVERDEKEALAPVAALASHPLDDETLALAQARVRARLLERTITPEGLAFVVGRSALYDGDPRATDRLFAALEAATSDDVTAAATRVLQAGRVVARGRERARWR